MAVCARLLRGVGVGAGVSLEGAEAVQAVVVLVVVADEAVSLPAAAAGPVLGAAGPVAAAAAGVIAVVVDAVGGRCGESEGVTDSKA